jgi:hypothetical protein
MTSLRTPTAASRSGEVAGTAAPARMRLGLGPVNAFAQRKCDLTRRRRAIRAGAPPPISKILSNLLRKR